MGNLAKVKDAVAFYTVMMGSGVAEQSSLRFLLGPILGCCRLSGGWWVVVFQATADRKKSDLEWESMMVKTGE